MIVGTQAGPMLLLHSHIDCRCASWPHAFPCLSSRPKMWWYGRARKRMVSNEDTDGGAVVMKHLHLRGGVLFQNSRVRSNQFKVDPCSKKPRTLLFVPLITAAMYAIRTGSCAVVVDPHYKNSDNKLGTLEPGKTLRVSQVGSSNGCGSVSSEQWSVTAARVHGEGGGRTARASAHVRACRYKWPLNQQPASLPTQIVTVGIEITGNSATQPL
eukprot:1161221-Pelagomonas_calceolata.AAC.7